MSAIRMLAAACVVLVGCSPAQVDAQAAAEERIATRSDRAAPTTAVSNQRSKAGPKRVDPRRGGLEIVLGEWAVSPEAPAIRPGEVTFVIHNRGTVDHGFEIELDGDSSGHGSGDLFKSESAIVNPGGTTRLTMTLAPGIYKIECLVDGHDDMGMEDVLVVRPQAPLVKLDHDLEPGTVSVADFAFSPATITVAAGRDVTWTNDDPTDHTVTSIDGTFGSDALGPGGSVSIRFTDPGVYPYRCAIHPDMRGQVRVE